MAGIGFKLSRLARDGGIGGVAAAAMHGAMISSGPWLMTAAAMIALQWGSRSMLGPEGSLYVQVILTYAFAVSALIAAPITTLTMRAVADSLSADNRSAVPGLMVVASLAVTGSCLVAATLLFGVLANLPAIDLVLAIAILTVLGQIWVANLFLTALKRHWPILIAFGAGIGVAAAILIFGVVTCRLVLLAITVGLITTCGMLRRTIGREFTGPAIWPGDWQWRLHSGGHLAAAGIAAVTAVWIDKWVAWFGPGSAPMLGWLRLNPIYDEAAFMGLLLIIPGLTLMVITVETRFELVFGRFMKACAVDGSFRIIERARREVGATLLQDARLLLIVQATIGCAAWVLAPVLFDGIGADARGIFAFRFTAIGLIFHLLATMATVVLAYYDLFGRILIVWGGMACVSAIGALLDIESGYIHFGWSFMIGALTAAILGILLVGTATRQLTYLIFVKNNPAIMGDRRVWI
jgi:uncharacterized membrane protein